MPIRPVEPRDRDRIQQIVESTGNFTGEEVATAIELVDETLQLGAQESGYVVHVLEDPARAAPHPVLGYVCYGPTPLTDGTYDLYWIAVDRAAQGAGHGRALIAFAEDDVRRRGGRLLIIETSSQEAYGDTVRFYERTGYDLAARIRDFYKPGDDKLIFVKALAGGGGREAGGD